MSILIQFEQQNLDQILALTKELIKQQQRAANPPRSSRGAGQSYKEQGDAVKTVTDRLREYTNANIKLASTLKAPLSEVKRLNTEFGKTPQTILPIAQRFQQLQKAGADSAAIFKTLARESGVTEKQFQALSKAANFQDSLKAQAAAAKQAAAEQAKLAKESIAAARAQERVAQQAAKAQETAARQAAAAQRKSLEEQLRAAAQTRNELVRLSQSLGTGFDSAKSFADRLGLSPKETNEAIARLRALQKAGLTAKQQFETLNRSAGISQNQFKTLSKEIKSVDARLASATKSGQGFNAAIAGFASAGAFAAIQAIGGAIRGVQQALVGFVQEALNANLQVRQLENALTSVFLQQGASTEEAIRQTGEALQFVREVADDTGQSFQVASKAYTQLSAAAQTSGVSQELLNELFTETNRVFGVFGLSAERAELAFSAITQILSKGQLSLEELRQQLGESLPIALRATADGLGVTTGQLIQLISTGQVSGREFAEAFTKGLQTVPGEVAKTQAAINALRNQTFFISEEVGRALEPIQGAFLQLASDTLEAAGAASGGLDPLIQAGERLTEVLEQNPEIAQRLGEALANIADSGIAAISGIIEELSEFLSNDAAVAQYTESFEVLGGAIEKLGGAVEFIINLSEGILSLQEAGANLPIIGDSIERLAQPFSASTPAIELIRGLISLFGLLKTTAINSAQETAEAVGEAFPALQPLLNQVERILNLLGADPEPVAFNGISEQVDSAGEALKSLDKGLGDVRESFGEGLAPAVAENLKQIAGDFKNGTTAIENEATAAGARIAEALAAGEITESEATGQRLEAERKAADERVKLAQATLERVRAAEDTTPAAVAEAEAEVNQARADAANARIDIKENEVETAKELEKERLEDLKKRFEEADRIIQRSQLSRERSTLQLEQALRAQGKTEEEIAERVGQAELKAQEQGIRDQIKLQQEKTAAYAEGTDERAEAELELASLQNELLSNQVDQERAAREAQLAAIEEAKEAQVEAAEAANNAQKRANEEELAGIDRVLAQRDRIVESLERQNTLLKTQSDLQNSIFEAQAQVAERGIAQAESALESRRRIKEIDEQLNSDNQQSDEDRKKLTQERAQLERQLRRDGFSSRATEQQIAQELLRRTRERFAQEQRALQLRQTLADNELEFEIQKDIFAAQRAVNEEQRGLRRLELQREELANEIALARIRGDEQAALDGESRLRILDDEIAAQKENIALADDALQREKEFAVFRRENQQVNQQAERAALADSQAADARQLENDLGETGGQAARAATALADATARRAEFENQSLTALAGCLDISNQLIDSAVRLADEAQRYANALNSVGISGNTPRQSLRKGGVAEGGLVQVHSDEFLVPPRGTRVVSQAESRRMIQQALASRPELAFNASIVRPQQQAISFGRPSSGESALIQEVRQLRQDVKRLKMQAGPIYQTNTTKVLREDRAVRKEIEAAQVQWANQLRGAIAGL